VVGSVAVATAIEILVNDVSFVVVVVAVIVVTNVAVSVGFVANIVDFSDCFLCFRSLFFFQTEQTFQTFYFIFSPA